MWILVDRYKSSSNYIDLEQKNGRLGLACAPVFRKLGIWRVGVLKYSYYLKRRVDFLCYLVLFPLVLHGAKVRRTSKFSWRKWLWVWDKFCCVQDIWVGFVQYFFLPNHWPQRILVAVRSKVPFDPLKIFVMRTRNSNGDPKSASWE